MLESETASEEALLLEGGSISACCGAMGVSLGTMVAEIYRHTKEGWDRWSGRILREWAEKGMAYRRTLLDLVDEDTNAFNKIMDRYFRLPKDTEEDKRKKIQKQEQKRQNMSIHLLLRLWKHYNSMEVMKAMCLTLETLTLLQMLELELFV